MILIGISNSNSEQLTQSKELYGSGPVSNEDLTIFCDSQSKLTVIIKITVYLSPEKQNDFGIPLDLMCL